MPDNDRDSALDPPTPMGGAVAAGLLRRQADGSYIAYNSPMPDDTPAPPDGAAMRAARVATARRLLHARLDARRVVYVGKSLDEAIYHLYAEAGEPYGGGLLGLTLWLDELTLWLDAQGEVADDRP